MIEKKIYKYGIPSKNKLLQFIFNFPGLSKLPLFSLFVRRHLKQCDNVSWSSGFKFLYGNIHAKNVGLSDTVFLDYANIYIGNKTNFGWGNIVITADHDPRNFDVVRCKSISIGSEVFITSKCIILPGVTIGNGSVIGAGTIVLDDVPPNCLFAGNPGKVVKYFNS